MSDVEEEGIDFVVKQIQPNIPLNINSLFILITLAMS